MMKTQHSLIDARRTRACRFLRPKVAVPGLNVKVTWYSHPNDSMDVTDWRKNSAMRTGQLIERTTVLW